MTSGGPAKQIRAAGIMIFRIINKKAEYLLLQASNLNHHWTPPKGHVELGETDIIAAKREVKEEAGLGPEDYDIIEGFTRVLVYEAWNKQKTVAYWAARVKNPDVPITISNEHQDFRWLDLPGLLEISEKENSKEAYQNLEAFLAAKLPLEER